MSKMTLLKAYLMNKRDPFTLAKAFLDVLKDEQAWREEQLGELGAKYFSEAMEFYEDELAEINGKIVENNTKIKEVRTRLAPNYTFEDKIEYEGPDGETFIRRETRGLTDEESNLARLELESAESLNNDYSEIRESVNGHLSDLTKHYTNLTGEEYDRSDENKIRLTLKGLEILAGRIDDLGEIKKPDSIKQLDANLENAKKLYESSLEELKSDLQEKNAPQDIITNETAKLKRKFEGKISTLQSSRNGMSDSYDALLSQKYKLEQRIIRGKRDLERMGIDLKEYGPKYSKESDFKKPRPKPETAEEKKAREEKEEQENSERRINLKKQALVRLAKRALEWEKQGFIPGPKYGGKTRTKDVELDRDYSRPITSGKYKGITLKGNDVQLDAKMTKLVNDSSIGVNELISQVNKLNPKLNVSLPETQKTVDVKRDIRGLPIKDKDGKDIPVKFGENKPYTQEEISRAKSQEQKEYMVRMNNLGIGKGKRKVKQTAGNLKNWKEWREEFSRVVSDENLQLMRDQLDNFFENLDPEVMRLFDKDAHSTDTTRFGLASSKEGSDGNIRWTKHVSRRKTLQMLGKIFSEALRTDILSDIQKISAKKIQDAIDDELGVSDEKQIKEKPVADQQVTNMMELLQDFYDETQILLESDTDDEWNEEPVERLESLTEEVAQLLQDMDEENPSQENYVNLLIRYHLINITIRELGKDLPNQALQAKRSLREYLNSLEDKYEDMYGNIADNELQSLQRLAQDSTDSEEDRKKLEQEIRRTSTKTSWKPPEGYYDKDDTVRRRERVKLHKAELQMHIDIFKRLSDGEDVKLTKPIRHPDQTDKEYAEAKRRFEPKVISGKKIPKRKGNQRPLKRLAEMVIPKFKVDMEKSRQKRMYGKILTQEHIDGVRNNLVAELGRGEEVDIENFDSLYSSAVDIIGPKSYTDRYKQVKTLTGKELEQLGLEDVKEEFLARRVRGEGTDDEEFIPDSEISDTDEFDAANTLMDQATAMVMNYKDDDGNIVEIPEDAAPYLEIVEQRFKQARDEALKVQAESEDDELPNEFRSKSGTTINFDEWLQNIESAKAEAQSKKLDESKYGEDKKVKRKPKRPVVKLPETRTIDEERERGENLLDPSILRRPEQEEEE